MVPKCNYSDCKWFDLKSFQAPYYKEGTVECWPAVYIQCESLYKARNYEKKDDTDEKCTCGLHL